MSAALAHKWLQSVVYKPGWRFSLTEERDMLEEEGRLALRITCVAPDSYTSPTGRRYVLPSGAALGYRPTEVTALLHEVAEEQGHEVRPFASVHRVPSWATSSKAAFVAWVFGQVAWRERHEAEEFFKVDGKHLHDPHPERTTG